MELQDIFETIDNRDVDPRQMLPGEDREVMQQGRTPDSMPSKNQYQSYDFLHEDTCHTCAPTWWPQCKNKGPSTSPHAHERQDSSTRSCSTMSLDSSGSQDHAFTWVRQSILRPRQRDNSDPLGGQDNPSKSDTKASSQKPEDVFCDDANSERDDANGCEDSEVRSLQEALKLLMKDDWQGLNIDFAAVPDMHPFAQQACLVTEQAMSGTTFHVFSDGSKKRHTAAWAFVVLCEANVGSCRRFFRIGYAAGIVSEDLGPFQCTALDAEATGIIAASEYLLSKSNTQNCCIYLHYDAESAGHGATGQQKQPTYLDGVSERQHAARLLVSLLQRKSESEMPSLQTILQNQFEASVHAKPDATLAQTQVSRQTDLQQQSFERKTLTFATANVGSMDYDGNPNCTSLKANELMRQFQDAGIHIVGIQESRAKQNQFLSQGPFARYVSAGKNGQAGVELWIQPQALAKMFCTDFHPEKDATVWIATDRILATRLQFGRLALEIVVAYAPQRGRPAVEVQEWWDHFRNVLEQRDRQAPLYILGDMNCQIGSVEGSATGSHCYDVEDEPGRRFREICEELGLFIPSTFEQFHFGPSATYIGTRGHESRIDFIAISEECQQGVIRSYVEQDLDLMNGDRDHAPLCLELALCVGASSEITRFTKKNLYNRHAARAEKASSRSCMLADLPQVDWKTEVNEHWDCIREHLQQKAIARFPCPKRQQRQLYFSPEAWQTLCDRKDLRQQYRHLQRCQAWTLLKASWHAWKGQTQQDAATGYWRLQRFVLQQQEACLYEKRMQLDKDFRRLKRRCWQDWVKQQLEAKLHAAKHANAVELFHILKPKQMIAKATGRLVKSLPGYIDEAGNLMRGRDDVAVAWQAQFGQIEHAEVVGLDDLLQRSQPQHCEARTSKDLSFIPTLYDLEEAIRSLQESKAVGVDGVGPELFNGHPAIAAQRLHPLIVKGAMRGQAVVEWCGGWLLPLWKKKGNPRDMKGYRAILLEPVIARATSKAWRSQLLQGLIRVAQPMQWGGRQGLSTESLHLHVQMWRRNARQQQVSQATVFVDIR
eukprot:s1038_g3.t1